MISVIRFIYKGIIKIDAEDYPDFLRIAKQFHLKIETESGLIPFEANSDEPPCKRRKISDVTNILSLPMEILTKILSMLSTYDLLVNVSRVSKHFNNFIKSPGVHIRVTFFMYAYNTDTLKFLKTAKLMKELQIGKSIGFFGRQWEDEESKIFGEMASSYDDMLESLSEHEHLKSFSFDVELPLTPDTGIILGKSKWWAKVTKLSLNIDSDSELDWENKFDPNFHQFRLALKLLESSEYLRHLDLNCRTVNHNNSVISFALSLKKLRSFRFVCPFENAGDLPSIIESNRASLEELRLENIKYYDKQILDGSQLDKCLNLKTLTAFEFSSFHFLPHLKKLTTLNLQVIEYNINDLKKCLRPNCLSQLENLTLSVNDRIRSQQNNEDHNALFKIFIEACPNLKSIDFDYLEKAGGPERGTIRYLLQKCSNLETLTLCSHPLYKIDEDLEDMSLPNLRCLEWLCTSKSEISRVTVQKLIVNCPSLSTVRSNTTVFLKSSMPLENITKILDKYTVAQGDDIKSIILYN
jgi:hypothetical protein